MFEKLSVRLLYFKFVLCRFQVLCFNFAFTMPPKKLKCDPALAEPTAKKPRVGAKPGMFKRHGSGAAAEPEAKRPRVVAKAKPKAKAANIQQRHESVKVDCRKSTH